MCVFYKEMVPRGKRVQLNHGYLFLTLNALSREVTLSSLRKLETRALQRGMFRKNISHENQKSMEETFPN